MVSWSRLLFSTLNCRVRVLPVSGISLFPLFNLSAALKFTEASLSSIPSNEEVFHCIFWRGCKAVGPLGPGSISFWLLQALVSHYYNAKPERVKVHCENLYKRLFDNMNCDAML